MASHSRSSSGLEAGTSGRHNVETRLCSRWPARGDQIRTLLDYVWDPVAAVPPLLVYGGPSTGKTAIIRCLNIYAPSHAAPAVPDQDDRIAP